MHRIQLARSHYAVSLVGEYRAFCKKGHWALHRKQTRETSHIGEVSLTGPGSRPRSIFWRFWSISYVVTPQRERKEGSIEEAQQNEALSIS